MSIPQGPQALLKQPPSERIFAAALAGDPRALRELYEWYIRIYWILGAQQSIQWDAVDKGGSELSDIETRTHAMLQSVLGWVSGADAAQDKHISAANGKVWQDHVEVTDANPHGTDHSQLDAIQVLDPTSADTAKDKHLSNAQGKAWQDHVGITDANPHGTNHSQLDSIAGTGDRHITASENAEITALDALAAGIVVKVGDASYTVRSVQGTANEIVLTFGDGQSGNPAVSLPLRIATPREFGTETNKAVIEADGTIRLDGDATGFQDENWSGATTAIGASAPSLVNWDTTSILVPSFPHNLTKELHALKEYDHRGKLGADGGVLALHAHVFPTTTAGGTAKYFCEYIIKNDGAAKVTGTLSGTVDLGTVAWDEKRIELGTISSVLLTQGTQIGLRLYRSSADPGTYSAPVTVTTWGYHWEADTPAGSRQITAK